MRRRLRSDPELRPLILILAAGLLLVPAAATLAGPTARGAPLSGDFGPCAVVPPGDLAPFAANLSEAVPCLLVPAPPSAALSIDWMSRGNAAQLAGWWSCDGSLGCLPTLPHLIYDVNGTGGSFQFGVSELGPRWTGASDILLSIWASAPDLPDQPLSPATTIEVVVTVA